MSCPNSVTTKTGTFTFHEESVTRCQAELNCYKRGELLAPITNRRDANKIVKFFKSNVDKENCTFAENVGYSYWIGLDITFDENKQEERVFTNGVQWNEKIHSKIYSNYIEGYTDCPITIFQPIFSSEPFPIMPYSESCNETMETIRYICLKPNDKSADPIIQDKDSFKILLTLTAGHVFAISASVVLLFAVGILAFVRLHSKNKRLTNENKTMKLEHGKVFLMKNSLMNTTTVGRIEEEI